MKFTTPKEAIEAYSNLIAEGKKKSVDEARSVIRELCLRDLFFLLYYILNRKDIEHQWLFERCKEVQCDPNGHLDLWAREHYKTTIITFGMTIQDLLHDVELTIGLFSFNRPTAKSFLRQLKWEFESNKVLYNLFPEIFWDDPQKNAPKWSEDDGLILKRRGNPKEATIEAWGLVDAMPTARHFKIRIYDDIITEQHVTNPEMIKKAIRAWELSLNLGSQQKCKRYKEANIQRYSGTRYHFNDPYREILARGVVTERKHPGTIDGKMNGIPILWSEEVMRKKRRDMGPYVFGCQILLNPKADEAQGFKREWLKYWDAKSYETYNLYLLCDPAGEKKKENDYTVILVIGLGEDENYYLVDGIRDRLNLTERTNKLFQFHRKYKPANVGYEKYGKDSDIEHIQYVMEKENYRFNIVQLGGSIPKIDRIRKLIPIFEQGRFYVPERLYFLDYEKKEHDLVKEFIDEEFTAFPVAVHDDILDCAARIVHEDLLAVFPNKQALKLKDPRPQKQRAEHGWML